MLCGNLATAFGKDATSLGNHLDLVNHLRSITSSPVLLGGCCVVWGEPLPLFPLAQRGPTSSVAPRSRAAVCVVRLFVRPLCEKGEDVASSPFSFHVVSRKSYLPTPVSQECFPHGDAAVPSRFSGQGPRLHPPILWRAPRLHAKAAARQPGSISISSATRSRPCEAGGGAAGPTNAVDGDKVPVRHFGAILRLAGLALAGRQAAGRRHPLHHRAAYPFQGRDRRAGDDVLPRPQRQRARVQILQATWPTSSPTRGALGGQRRGFFFAWGGMVSTHSTT